jgi:hypothetical protein
VRNSLLAITKVASCDQIPVYFDAVAGVFAGGCRIESPPTLISSPLNGGDGFAGKSGRKTANAGDTNAMETSTDTAAHFMLVALSKIKRRGK